MEVLASGGNSANHVPGHIRVELSLKELFTFPCPSESAANPAASEELITWSLANLQPR